MRASKRLIISLIAGVLLLALIFVGSDFVLTPAGSYTRLLFHELYAQERVDIAFAGSSNCYRAYDPAVIDALTGKNTFNIGSSLQTMKGTYYMVAELLRVHRPETVVLSLSPTGLLGSPLHSDLSDLILIKFMANSAVRADYFVNLSDSQQVSTVFYGRAFMPGALKPAELFPNIKAKCSAAYRNFDASVAASEKEYYVEKGFVYSRYGPLQDGEIGDILHSRFDADFAFNDASIDQNLLEYFDKTVALCREKGVEVLIVSPAAPRASVLAFEGYDKFLNFCNDYAAAREGVSYYNFALLRPEKLVLRNSGFYDDCHQNGDFAAEYSAAFAHFLNECADGTLNPDAWFYASLDEFAAASDIVEAAWLSVEKQEDGTLFLTAKSACAAGVTPAYALSYRTAKDAPWQPISDYANKRDNWTFTPEPGVAKYTFLLCARDTQSTADFEQRVMIGYEP